VPLQIQSPVSHSQMPLTLSSLHKGSDSSQSSNKVTQVALAVLTIIAGTFIATLNLPVSAAIAVIVLLLPIHELARREIKELNRVNVPKALMREAPCHNAKVVSQAVMGEPVQVEKTSMSFLSPTWVNIRTSDGYKGWVCARDLSILPSHRLQKGKEVTRVTARGGGYLYAKKDTEYGPAMTIPYGSTLHLGDTSDARWAVVTIPDGSEFFIQKGDIAPQKPIKTQEQLVAFSKSFLGTHYAWGGKSGNEYDCSGFTQMLVEQLKGKKLPRDAKDQIKDSQLKEIAAHEVEACDLVFFGGEQDKIRHVGMCLGNGEFIHATVADNKPWVRISRLDEANWNGQHPSRPYRAFRRLKDMWS